MPLGHDLSQSVAHDSMYAGELSFARRPYTRDLEQADIAVVGIPFDLTTVNRPGTRFGPRAIREQSSQSGMFPWGLWPWGFNLFEHHRVIDYHTWLAHPEPGLWQSQPTDTVVSVRVFSDNFIRWADAVGEWWPGIADTIEPQFFRIVASSNLLSEPIITNHLRVLNSTDSMLSNLWFSSCPSGTAFLLLTNIPVLLPTFSSPSVAVAAPRLQLGELNWNYVMRPDETNAYKSWLITWEQDGTNRHCGTSVLPFGAHEKVVTVTVYSNRVTTYYDWLGPGGTLPY